MSTIPELVALKQRKHQRAMQQASYGMSADPSITTELNKLDSLISQMERIDTHRRRLAQLLQTRSHFGADVPPHIALEINHEREQIAVLRANCHRLGQPVDSHAVDEDEVAAEIEPAASSSLVDIGARLDAIERHLSAAIVAIRELRGRL